MSRRNYTVFGLTLGICLCASIAAGQAAPPAINYQGRLTQSTGVVVADGLTGMRVRIFATASGGSALWDSGDLSVATKSGTFSILLGSGGMPAMSPVVFALGTVYIELQPTGQAPLLPRQPIASVPWALYAQTVSNGAITTVKLGDQQVTLDKLANQSVSTAKLVDGAITSAKIADGSVETPKLADSAVTSAKIASSASSLSKVSGGAMTALGGLIGIGTANPKQALHNTGDYYGKGSLWLYAYGGDGNSGTAYIQARDTSNSSSIEMLFRTQLAGNYVEALKIAPNGNVGIGTMGPQFKLDVSGGARVSNGLDITAGGLNVANGGMIIQSGGIDVTGSATVRGDISLVTAGQNNISSNKRMLISSGTENGESLYLNPTGLAVFVGNAPGTGTLYCGPNALKGGSAVWTTWSDARLKRNIRPIARPLAQLLTLHGRSFEFDPKGIFGAQRGLQLGFIAQEVEGSFPEWVGESQGFKTVTLKGFDALAVEAIREQQAEIVRLKRDNADMKAANRTLEQRLGQLERTTADLERMVRDTSSESVRARKRP